MVVAPARPRRPWPAAVMLAFVMLLLVPVAASARTRVRFVHAVPAVGRVAVTVAADPHRFGSIAFGEATSWRAVRAGALRWSLSAHGHAAASGTTRVGSGDYDLVVVANATRIQVRAYRTSAGRRGKGLVRVIHAAPGLGSPQLRVDGRLAVRRLSYLGVTPYLALAPGRHRLDGDRPGDSTPFVSGSFSIRAGVADSVVVIGSDGRRVRMIALTDRTATHATRRAHTTTHRTGTATRATRGTRTVRVRAGQSLWSIARTLVGPRASDTSIERRLLVLWHANATRIGTGDPSLIYPGTRLSI